MANGGLDADHEGVGRLCDLVEPNPRQRQRAVRWVRRRVDGPWTDGRARAAVGQRVRAALAWSSHTSGSNTAKADALMAVSTCRSAKWRRRRLLLVGQPYEVVDITVATSGTLRIEIRHDRFDLVEGPSGVAWAVRGPFFDPTVTLPLGHPVGRARGNHGGLCRGRYCPDSAVTREQMASFLRRAGGVAGSSVDHFTDDESSIHEADINAIAAAGITGGCAATRYCPRS